MVEQKTFKLTAQKRELTGKKVKTLRSAGFLPAVVYGRGEKPEVISVEKAKFEKIFSEAGTSSLIDLTIEDENEAPPTGAGGISGDIAGAKSRTEDPLVRHSHSPTEVRGLPVRDKFKVLTHEPQLDPVKGFPIHVDFYRVKMDEKITTEIPLEFIGKSEAVEQLEGSLVTNRDNVEVECLPNDLVGHITVDISTLKTFEDTITVANLPAPAGIEILTDKEEVIAIVEPPRSEEELAELETPTAAEEEKEALEKMGAEAEAEKAEGEAVEGEETTGTEPAETEKTPEEKK